MAPAGLTQVQAVNDMLSAIKEWPVTSVPTSDDGSTAYLASMVLDREDIRVQSKGWHENREDEVELYPLDKTKYTLTCVGATWTAATRVLAKVGAFPAATYIAWDYGDQVYISAPTANAGWYQVEKWIDANSIRLTNDDLSATDVGATLTATVIGWENAVALESDILRVDGLYDDVIMRNAKLLTGTI